MESRLFWPRAGETIEVPQRARAAS